MLFVERACELTLDVVLLYSVNNSKMNSQISANNVCYVVFNNIKQAIWISRHRHLGISIGSGISITIGIAKILFLPF